MDFVKVGIYLICSVLAERLYNTQDRNKKREKIKKKNKKKRLPKKVGLNILKFVGNIVDNQDLVKNVEIEKMIDNIVEKLQDLEYVDFILKANIGIAASVGCLKILCV